MVKQLFYVSEATPEMNDDEWRRIESSSSIYNALNNITGLCCYDGSGFMQLIEGPAAKADELLARIEADHCHSNVSVRYVGEIPHASYGEWAMRFCTVGEGASGREQVERLLPPALSPELRSLMLDWAGSD